MTLVIPETHPTGLRRPSVQSSVTRSIWVNEDNAHFYDQHPSQSMTEAGVRNLVDRYAVDSGVAGLILNVNVQRALFDSRVWEPLYHGYDPDGPDDQPLLRSLPAKTASMTPDQRGRYWVHNLWLLKQRGVDHPAVWLDQCRKRGVAGWLSVRMNDCHHNDDENAFWHSSLWKTRPDLRRVRHRDGDWFESAFDYGKPEVVEHHMKLIRELFDRYEFDGIELDWMRWVRHFRPGGEQAGAGVLTEIMREVRHLADEAAARHGHPVRVGVRLPSDPRAALDLGYDVITWTRERLVDQVALAPFFQQAEFDWPIALWRALLGDGVTLLCQPESAIRPYPEAGQRALIDYPILFGSAASARARGADGVYLFNECYRMAPGDRWTARHPDLLQKLFTDLASNDRLREMRRRHPVSHAQVVSPGNGDGSLLPVTLAKPPGYWSFGRHGSVISLRICLGQRPVSSTVSLELGFDTLQSSKGLQVWLNGQPVCDSARPIEARRPSGVVEVLAFQPPPALLQDDVNIIDLLPRPGAPGQLVWAEMIVHP